MEYSVIYSFYSIHYYSNKRDVIIGYVVSYRWIWDRDVAHCYTVTFHSISGLKNGQFAEELGTAGDTSTWQTSH